MLWQVAIAVAAYAVADAMAGLYHLATDRGFNIPSQLAFFRKHHAQPGTMTFDLEPMLAGVPLLVYGWWVGCSFALWLGLWLSIAQLPHYYTHHPAPVWVKLLQRIRVFLPPEKHAAHHTPPYERDFCVLCGWNDWWINSLAAAFPNVRMT